MPRPPEGPKLRPNPKRRGTFYIYWTDPATGRSREHSTGTGDQGRAVEYFAGWLARQGNSIGAAWTGPRRASEVPVIDVLRLYAREHVADKVADKVRPAYAIAALAGWWTGHCDTVLPQTCRAYARERGAGAGTVRYELSMLRAALGFAHDNGKLVENCRRHVELPPGNPGRDRWLSRSEAARLLWESRRDRLARGHLPLFILIALATGARPAAIFDLRWTQVDFTNNRVDFNPPGRQRTSKGRPIISIPRRLRWFLLRAHARASSPYVLSYGRRQKLTTVKDSFRNARTRAGLGDDVIPYVLRHTCACWLAQAGVDLCWNCRCDCGVDVVVLAENLRAGLSKSCGCYRAEFLRSVSVRHGHTLGGRNSPERQSWRGMKDRCTNPNHMGYRRYGGRGITVCERWLNSFENFYADMGLRPPGTSLDRWPDPDGNYEPGNCRWATAQEQQAVRRPPLLTALLVTASLPNRCPTRSMKRISPLPSWHG